MLRNPETEKSFELLPAEIAFLEHAFRIDEDGRAITLQQQPDALFNIFDQMLKFEPSQTPDSNSVRSSLIAICHTP